MTSIYEHALTRLSEASGAAIELGEDRVANVVVEERVVTLKPSDEAESALTAFTIVAHRDDGGSFPAATLERALAMNLFGAQTDGGHIGLFGNALFLSKTFAVEGMSPEALAEELVVLVRLADEIGRELDGEEPSSGLDAQAVPDDMPRIGSAFGGFMQV